MINSLSLYTGKIIDKFLFISFIKFFNQVTNVINFFSVKFIEDGSQNNFFDIDVEVGKYLSESLKGFIDEVDTKTFYILHGFF